MEFISATFVDHWDAEAAVTELRHIGAVDVGMTPLADVDPPLADPVLVSARIHDGSASAAREVLQANRGSVEAHLTYPEASAQGESVPDARASEDRC